METIGHINIPDHVIDALERGILKAVQDRIDNDPDVADTYSSCYRRGQQVLYPGDVY